MFLSFSKKIVIGFIVLFNSSLSFSGTFHFFQGGYQEGAFIEGTFNGEDLDGNGQISSFDGTGDEVTDITVSFSGNSLVPAFTLEFPGSADQGLIIYDVDSGFIGDDEILVEGISISLGDLGYAGGGCSVFVPCFQVFDDANGFFDETSELVQITQVANGLNVPVLPWYALILFVLIIMVGVNKIIRRTIR